MKKIESGMAGEVLAAANELFNANSIEGMRKNLREMMDSFFLQQGQDGEASLDECYCTFKELDKLLMKLDTMSKAAPVAARMEQPN